jgi:biopolymer transport protein ExbB/TolQ
VGIEEVLFDVSDALRIPVLVLALLTLALVLVEAGAMVVEMVRRRGRGVERLERAVDDAGQALGACDPARAEVALWTVSWNDGMRRVMSAIIGERGKPDAEARIAKRLAEFDYGSVRRLERTRILVRMGPALGLMGTLIPLSPALVGLADGDVAVLSENLRVAFSVTVAGLFVGAVAFAISLVRDRLYGQDYSDLEYAAETLRPQAPQAAPAPAREAA